MGFMSANQSSSIMRHQFVCFSVFDSVLDFVADSDPKCEAYL